MNAPNGADAWLDMDASPGNITISKDVSLVPGADYTPSFDANNRRGTGALEVVIDGQVVQTVTPSRGTHFEYQTIDFTETNANSTIELREIGQADGFGTGLANIRIN